MSLSLHQKIAPMCPPHLRLYGKIQRMFLFSFVLRRICFAWSEHSSSLQSAEWSKSQNILRKDVIISHFKAIFCPNPHSLAYGKTYACSSNFRTHLPAWSGSNLWRNYIQYHLNNKQENGSVTVIVCPGTTADKVSCSDSFCLPVKSIIPRPYYFHFHAELLKNKKKKHYIDDLMIW